MAINGLGSFDMMSAYNRIDFADRTAGIVKPVNEEVSKEANSVQENGNQKAQEEKQELKVNLNLEGMRRRPSVSFDDISRDFAKREPYSLTRVDDKAMQNEIMKAVSEMEEDQSIQQYQYFVGGNNVILDDEDGTVVMK